MEELHRVHIKKGAANFLNNNFYKYARIIMIFGT